MRSYAPMPGNPWPHDMIIEVDDSPHALIELLWMREARGLRPSGDDLPPLLIDTPDRVPEAIDNTGWTEAWPVVWSAAIEHAGLIRDPSIFARLQATADRSPERAELLEQIVGPTARDTFGEAFDDSWASWSTAQFDARQRMRPHALEDHPERRSLDSLIAAWRRGLTKIVTIPITGDYVRVIGPHALLTTDAIRADPARYSEALAAFE
jgi:hypothetical protein